MKKLVFAAAIACLSLFASCEKQGVEHTGDDSGILYGTWALDTKTVMTETTNNGKTDQNTEETSFSTDRFFLYLYEPRLAFGQEGTLLTFDIDDVDAVPFSYNAELKQLSFDKMIRLSKGLLGAKTMTLYGTYDILELTNEKLELYQQNELVIGELKSVQKTTYRYHKVGPSPSAAY